MRLGSSHALAWLPLMGSLAPLVHAADVVYVTDLSIYTLLAPCAQSALSYNIMSMTYDSCPEAVTDLQSCVCSKNNYFASLSADVSSDVSDECGSTASSDQASASTVFSAYCNQKAVVNFPSPTIPVSQYITDIPEMSYLAPCASSQVAYVVMGMTYSLCPPDAGNLATCVCQKNQNSLMVSQSINSAVSQECSSHTADIASAQAFFSAFCNLNSGTSSFPAASSPPGDMSYYITDMPQYSSLARCAKNALSSAVLGNTYNLCPSGPQLLASCACIKESMPSVISSYITSNIQWDCTSGDAADVSSVMSIYNMYCSAAKNEKVVSGITTSVSQTQPLGASGGGGATGTGPKATGGAGGGSTGGSGSGGNGSSTSGDSNGGSTSNSKKSNTGVIVGAVIGVVGGLVALGIAAFFVFRNARRNKNRPPATNFQQLDNLPPGHGNNADSISMNNGGKSELAGSPIVVAGAVAGAGAVMLSADNAAGGYGPKPPLPPPSPSLSMSKYNNLNGVSPQSPPNPSVSPASAYQQQQQPGAYSYPFAPPQQAELPGQMYSPNSAYPTPAAPSYSELQGQHAFPQAPQQPHAQAELYGGQPNYGQAVPYGHQPQQPQVIHQADSIPIESPNRLPSPAAAGMTYHSGPLPQTYSELGDGNNHHAA